MRAERQPATASPPLKVPVAQAVRGPSRDTVAA